MQRNDGMVEYWYDGLDATILTHAAAKRKLESGLPASWPHGCKLYLFVLSKDPFFVLSSFRDFVVSHFSVGSSPVGLGESG